jgi:hypothetical protein
MLLLITYDLHKPDRDYESVATSEDAAYFVMRLTQNWASYGLDAEVTDWLKSTARTW